MGQPIERGVRLCAGCGTENRADDRFCRECGQPLPVPPEAAAALPTCPSCGKPGQPGQLFCSTCGAPLAGAGGALASPRPAHRPPLPAWALPAAAAGVVAAVAIAAAAFLVLGGGDGDDEGRVDSGLVFAEPVALSDQAKTDLQAALDALPEPVGDTDAEQLRSVLGPPDVFQLWFEPLDGGGTARSETWYYLDLEVSYEFRDGVLLFTIPMDEVPGLVLVPLRYDPLNFSEATTVDDVRAMLDDPADLVPEDTPAEYELGVTVWAGEQVMAAFDENGELLYVETVAMDLGDGS